MGDRKIPEPRKPEGKDTVSSSFESWNETLERPAKVQPPPQKGGR